MKSFTKKLGAGILSIEFILGITATSNAQNWRRQDGGLSGGQKAAIIAGGTAAGAVIGGLLGGKKGALIGGAIAGGTGTAVVLANPGAHDRDWRDRDWRYRDWRYRRYNDGRFYRGYNDGRF